MQPFAESPLRKLFNNASQEVLNGNWKDFYFQKQQKIPVAFEKPKILPCPDLSTLPRFGSRFSSGLGISFPTEGEDRLTWQIWAKDFISSYNERIADNLRQMEKHLTNELAAWNSENKEKNKQLTFDAVWLDWMASIESLSLAKFSSLHIHKKTAYDFLTPKFDKIKARYNISNRVKKKPDKKIDGVKAVAAMCYYLNETGFLGSKSVRDFVATEILPVFRHTQSSIETKCGQYKKSEYRTENQMGIKNAISLMNTHENFHFSAAIKKAELDLAIIDTEHKKSVTPNTKGL